MSDGVRVFRGVPFAAAERFRPPRVLPLTEVPAAGGEFGPAAAQLPDRLDYIWGERLAPGSEDCLTLNVYTPDLNGNLPVLVWVHGGAFIIGSGRWPWFDASKLAAEQRLVVVTINYRLGAFGFLDLSEYGEPDSGNHGLLDQVATLEWVKANIARFGGDPAAVTLAGQSAGGISVSCLLGSPRARGLFHRAVVMSGPPSLVRGREFARRVTGRFLRAAGVTSPDGLQTLPLPQLLLAQWRTLKESDFVGEMVFGPTVGDGVLPEPPLHAVRGGSASGVSLLCGTTADEVRLWSLYNPILWAVPPAALGNWVRSLGLAPADLRDAYRRDRPDLRFSTVSMGMIGDALFGMPMQRLAEAHAAHGDTRVYVVGWKSPVHGGRLGALHGVEVPLLFGTTTAGGAVHILGDPTAAEPVSAVIRKAWGAFVRTGDPTAEGLPHWPPFDPATRPTMLLNEVCKVKNDPLPAVRRVWDGLPFDGVRPSLQDLPRIADVGVYLGVRAAMMLAVVVLVAVVMWLLLR